MDLRGLIIGWIKTNGIDRHYWLMGVYQCLIGHGAKDEDAVKALSDFVDEIIAMKKSKKHERPSVGD